MTRLLLLFLCAFFLPAFQAGGPLASGEIVIDTQEWRGTPSRHLFVHGVMNGDNAFQLFLPDPKDWQNRAIQFLEGGLGGNEKAGMGLGNHLHALAHGAVYVESSQGHRGMSFFDDDDSTAELAYQANYAVMAYAKTRCVELYGREPEYVYVYGGSGGGMRSIELMERFPDVYDGAVPLVAPSDFQMGAFEFSLYDAYRAPLEAKREALDDAVRPGSERQLTGVPGSAEEKEALERLLNAGYPMGSLWLIGQGVTGVMVLDYLKYKGLPDYFEDFWKEPGFEGKDGRCAAELVRGVKGKVVGAVAEKRRIKAAWEGGARSLYGYTVTFTSGALKGAWRRIYSNTGQEIAIGFVGPGIDGVEPGDEFELDNRDLLAWKALHRHLVIEGEPAMRQFFSKDGNPLYRQIETQKLCQLREPERKIGSFRGKMICIYGTDDPLIWPALGLHYQRLVRQASGDRIDEHYRIHFLEHGVHGIVMPKAESRQVSQLPGFRKALDDLIAWVEKGTPPAPGTRFTVDRFQQIRLAPTASARQGYQPVVTLLAGGRKGRLETAAGSVVTFAADAEDPDNELVRMEIDYEGDGVYDESRAVRGRRASAQFDHRYAHPGTYFATVRVTDSTHTRGSDAGGIQNLGIVRVVVR